jgi:hypothetical protein
MLQKKKTPVGARQCVGATRRARDLSPLGWLKKTNRPARQSVKKCGPKRHHALHTHLLLANPLPVNPTLTNLVGLNLRNTFKINVRINLRINVRVNSSAIRTDQVALSSAPGRKRLQMRLDVAEPPGVPVIPNVIMPLAPVTSHGRLCRRIRVGEKSAATRVKPLPGLPMTD